MKDFLSKNKEALLRISGALLALLVWQLASMALDQQLFLASPVTVAKKLWELMGTLEFYLTLGRSLLNIVIGFLCAAVVGSALGALSYKSGAAKVLLRPYISVIKATPVASFIILVLILWGSRSLSAIISFLMVLPVFYTNVLGGLNSVESERFEAAEVFGMARSDRFRFIYLPYLLPHFTAACSVGLGMAWKSGVAAEVVGLAAGSIGEKLYEAKLYLDTAELFAYTAAGVLLSIALERLTLSVIKLFERKMIGD